MPTPVVDHPPTDPGPLTAPLIALAAEAADRAAELDELRRLPDDLAARLAATDVGRALALAPVDGGPADLPGVLGALRATAALEGSTAWCAMIAATTSAIGGWLPDDHLRTVFGSPGAMVGGYALPAGRAVPVPGGGLRVTGRWSWGSGIHHCTWIGGGCLVVDDDGRPTPRDDGLRAPFVLMEPAQVEILDTWRPFGLRGTGSTDYRADGVLVPEGRWVQVGDPPRHPDPLYRVPFLGLLAAGVASVLVGLADRALGALVDLAATKRPVQSSRTLAERPATQAAVARSEAALRAAWLFLEQAVASALRGAAVGSVTDGHRRDLRLAATHAASVATGVVDRCHRTAGGSAVPADHPLARALCDAHVAAAHGMIAERTLEPLGRMRLGLPTDTRSL